MHHPKTTAVLAQRIAGYTGAGRCATVRNSHSDKWGLPGHLDHEPAALTAGRMNHGIRAQLIRYRNNVVTCGTRRQEALQPTPKHTELGGITREIPAPPQREPSAARVFGGRRWLIRRTASLWHLPHLNQWDCTVWLLVLHATLYGTTIGTVHTEAQAFH
jgi:hypothetical protein